MDEKYIAILGGLVGSGFTIFVSKLFEFFQSKQIHLQGLRRELFLRKLNVFEKTVSYLTIAHTSLTNMAILIKISQNENVTFTSEQGSNIFHRLDSTIQDIYKITQETAGAIDLYIELDHNEQDVKDTEKFWELLGTLNFLSQEVNRGYDLLLSGISEQDYTQLQEAIVFNSKLLAVHVDELLTLSNSIRTRFLKVGSVLRNELKKYT